MCRLVHDGAVVDRGEPAVGEDVEEVANVDDQAAGDGDDGGPAETLFEDVEAGGGALVEDSEEEGVGVRS